MKMKMSAYIRVGLLAAILVIKVQAAAPEGWAVKDATIRFVVDLTQEPSHPSAG